MNSERQPSYLVGISGGSASGKTYLLRQLLRHFPKEDITLISQDNYYRHISELEKDDEGYVNFDHPKTIDFEKFIHDVSELKAGRSVTLEEYTFNNPDITPKMITYNPAPIILVEGLFVFYEQRITQQLDLKVFVDAEEHIKLSRRIKRDFAERNFELEEILYVYEAHVIPMYKKYIAPYKEDCNLIIPNNFHMEKAVQVLIDHLHARIGH